LRSAERIAVLLDRPGAPAGALARLQQQHRNAGLDEAPPGGDPSGAGADHRDIDFGRKAPHCPGKTLPQTVMAGLVPAIHVDPRDKPGDDGRMGSRMIETNPIG
jgi:hypothetical protein